MTRKRKTLLWITAGSLVFFGLAAIGAAVGDPPATRPVATDSTFPSATSTVTGENGATTPIVPPAKPPTVPTPIKPKPKPSTRTTTKPPTTDHRYATCKEAKAHGLGPYYRGIDPEYNWYKDADSDGIVCE